ncbi:MAG: hypothetical protein L3J74_10140 [Bacteroidales bacterium]|nr:hypothetical protein [Bacteroidales bacterium]
MKRFKLLLVALATISFTAFYACGGEQKTDEGNTETEQVQEAPETPETPQVEEQTEEVKDSTAVENNEENAETPAEEKTEGGE